MAHEFRGCVSNRIVLPILSRDGERWRWRGDLERRGELELNGKKFERFMSRDYIRRIFSQSGEKRIEICKSCRREGIS